MNEASCTQLHNSHPPTKDYDGLPKFLSTPLLEAPTSNDRTRIVKTFELMTSTTPLNDGLRGGNGESLEEKKWKESG